ncbi:MAG: transposase [Dehalococcoidia bacterium]|nr:transposase [Dehalococcoidia bacterium]
MNAEHSLSLQHRRSIRLAGYDYGQVGAYFLTICAYSHECLFGEIADGEMVVNAYGMSVLACWGDLPHHYRNVLLDAFVIRPNHVHGIVILTGSGSEVVGAGLKPAPTVPQKPAPTVTAKPAPSADAKVHPLSEITRAFKTFSSRRINELRRTPGVPVWQGNYYEHIIRNEDEMNRIREYIIHNPSRWAEDVENPGRTQTGIRHSL